MSVLPRSFKGKMAVVLAVSFLTLLALFFYGSVSHLENGKQLVSSYQMMLTRRVALDLDTQLETATRMLDSVAQRVPRQLLAGEAGGESWLEGRSGIRTAYFDHGTFLIGKDGRLLSSFGADVVMRQRQAAVVKWARIALELDEPVLSLPFWLRRADGAEVPVMVVVVPVTDAQGNVLGAMAGAMDLYRDSLLGNLSRLLVGDAGYLFMLGWNGQVIMHPDLDLIGRRDLSVIPQGIKSRVLHGEQLIQELPSPKGVSELVGLVKMQSTGWILGTAHPTGSAYATFTSQQQALGLLMILGFMLVAGTTLLALNRFIRPLDVLSRHIGRMDVRRGRLAPVVLETSSEEINQLIQTFNELLVRVRRNQEELALAASVFENVSDGIIVCDSAGNILSVNSAFSRITGYSAAQVQGKNPRILKSGLHDADFYAEIWRSIGEAGAWQGEIFNRSQCGEIYAESLKITAVPDETGTAALLIGVFADITDKKARESAATLAQEGNQIKFAVSQILQDISSDFDARILSALSFVLQLDGVLADGGCQLFLHHGDDYAHDYRQGHSLWFKPMPADAQRVRVVGLCELRVPQHGHYFIPIELNQKSYGVLVIDTVVNPPQGEERVAALKQLGEVFALAFVNEHLTRLLRDAKEKADAASLAKSLFLANMSHEIRTPMNGVLGTLQLMQALEMSPDVRELNEVAYDSANSLLTIINDILDFSKIEAGKFRIEEIGFNLHRVIADIARTQALACGRKNLKLVVHIADGMPVFVIGDPTRVRQVILNLISNAIKFTEQGEISLLLEPDPLAPERYRVMVRDTGIGMSPALMAGLFQAFNQGDASHTRQFGGTGLGLSICKSLVELMGGRIWAQSELGHGTTMTFLLPLRLAEPQAEADEVQNGTDELVVPAQSRILVVEDNPTNQRVVLAMLARLGLGATLANNGLEALARLDEQTFDLVLMDCQMPELDGYAATRQVRAGQVQPGIPILAMTAHAMEGDAQTCFASGMDDYMTKPLDIRILKQKLAFWLAPDKPQHQPDPSPGLKASVKNSEFDDELLLGNCGHDMDLVREIVPVTLDDMPLVWHRLETGLAQGDMDTARRQAHILKGLAAQLGGMRLADSVQVLEVALREGRSPGELELAQSRQTLVDLLGAVSDWLVRQ